VGSHAGPRQRAQIAGIAREHLAERSRGLLAVPPLDRLPPGTCGVLLYGLRRGEQQDQENGDSAAVSRAAKEHQDLLRLLAAFESSSETALIEEAIELLVQSRALSYRNALGLPRDVVAVTPETVHELVPQIREAIQAAVAGGATAPSEGDLKRRLRDRARSAEPVAAG